MAHYWWSGVNGRVSNHFNHATLSVHIHRDRYHLEKVNYIYILQIAQKRINRFDGILKMVGIYPFIHLSMFIYFSGLGRAERGGN